MTDPLKESGEENPKSPEYFEPEEPIRWRGTPDEDEQGEPPKLPESDI